MSLPSDVVEEILAWLPVQSLFRFKCINKSQCSLIQNPSFASKHVLYYHRSTSGFDHALFNLGNTFSLLDSPNIGELNNIHLGNKFSLLDSPNIDLNNVNDSSWIVGHCNGLICFTTLENHNLTLNLWNPVLKQHEMLPQSDILLSKQRLRTPEEDNLGFGYDPESQDYKVVQFAFYRRNYGSSYDMKAEVYSLRDDSWRPVVHTLDPLGGCRTMENRYRSCVACLGRFCYWSGYTKTNRYDNNENVIISYDTTNEMFRQRYLLEQVRSLLYSSGPFLSSSTLFVWKGSLALVTFLFPSTKVVRFIHIWSMEDSGLDLNHSPTVKEHRVLDLDLNRTLMMKKRSIVWLWNDELFFKCHNKCLSACNITTGQIRVVSLPRSYVSRLQVIGYTRSLVSLLS